MCSLILRKLPELYIITFQIYRINISLLETNEGLVSVFRMRTRSHFIYVVILFCCSVTTAAAEHWLAIYTRDESEAYTEPNCNQDLKGCSSVVMVENMM